LRKKTKTHAKNNYTMDFVICNRHDILCTSYRF
jgi:hypothetical protein